MSGISNINDQVVSAWLGSRIEPYKPQKSVVFGFISELLKIFGIQYAQLIQPTLGKNTYVEYLELNNVYCEIQEQLEKGVTVYTDIHFPRTKKFLDKYRKENESKEQFFEILKGRAIKSLRFPQKVLLYERPYSDSLNRIEEIRKRVLGFEYPDRDLLERLETVKEKLKVYRHPLSKQLLEVIKNKLEVYSDPDLLKKIEEAIEYESYLNPELETLARVEEEEIHAFNLMLGRLRPPRLQIEDEKGAPSPGPVKQREWTADEEKAIARLYFTGVALIFNGRIVHFWELIEVWKILREGAARSDLLLFGPMNFQNWVKPEPDPIPEFAYIPAKAMSFHEFIVECSLIALQHKLKVNFSDSLKEVFKRKFLDEELIRRDIFFFLIHLERFYEMDLKRWNRLSMPLLQSIQIFIFVVRTYKVAEEHRSNLLEMIIHRSEQWKLDSFGPFTHRAWNYKLPLQEDREMRMARKGLYHLLKAGNKSPFQDPFCWPLFYFFWKNPQLEEFYKYFGELVKNPHFKITLEILYTFLIRNGGVWDIDTIKFFYETHITIIRELGKNGIRTERAECFMIDPPFPRIVGSMALIPLIERKTGEFVHLMRPYDFPYDERYIKMLRGFVFRAPSDDLMFKLLNDCTQFGIVKPSEALIAEVLSKDHEGIDVLGGARQEALGITSRLQKQFHFSEVEIFTLYMEIIRLAKVGKAQETISRINAVVMALEKFCPVVEKLVSYFLFLYHPQVSSEEVDDFENLRLKWAKSKRLDRFSIPDEEFVKIRGPITTFAKRLSEACNDSFLRDPFVAKLSKALESGFFPPEQPIVDAFKISNVTVERGILWLHDIWSTHLGQLIRLLNKADIGIYFDWDVFNDHPVFIMSFFDVGKKRGFSMAVPIQISVEELNTDPKRRGFYMYLYTMSLKVLKENLKESPPIDLPETSEVLMPYYDLLKEDLNSILENPDFEGLTREEISAVWTGFKKIKEMYRKLFYCITADRRPPPIEMHEHAEVAAVGHIFPSHPRGSLLPKSHLDLAANPECFIPDASEQEVKGYPRIFADSTSPSEKLNLNLHIVGRALPIRYQSQTASELTRQNVEKIRPREWDERAAPHSSIYGRYVYLSVDLDGRPVRAPFKYPQEAFREKNEVLYARLSKVLGEDAAKILQDFEGENKSLLDEFDERSTQLLYGKLLTALGKKSPRISDAYDERGTRVVYTKLLKAVEKGNPKFLEAFRNDNREFFDSNDEKSILLLYQNLLNALKKEKPKLSVHDENSARFIYSKISMALEKVDPKLLETFKLENKALFDAYDARSGQSLCAKFLDFLRDKTPKFLEAYEEENLKILEIFEAENAKLLDSLGKVNLEFLKTFEQEEAQLFKTYEENGGAKLFQTYFDFHNLRLKHKVYYALRKSKDISFKETSEESLVHDSDLEFEEEAKSGE